MSSGSRASLSLRTAFAALRYPNYRLWFWGQMLSLFGSWMQITAQGFLVFQLTHSPAYLGIVSFASGISIWMFMLYGGVVADRVPRRTLLIITQSFMMLLALILSLLTFLRLVQPWHIVVLAFCLGIANSFDAPARQAFVSEMVGMEDLTNAIALNSTMFNTATAIGPAAGGVIYALVGPGWCFLINGVSYLAVIFALALMKIQAVRRLPVKTTAVSDLKEGVLYIGKQPEIRSIIVVITLLSLFGLSYVTLFPSWAVTILHGGADTNGLLQSARGIGALIGALFIAFTGKIGFKGKLFSVGTFAFPVMVLVFSLTRTVPTTVVVLVFAGVAQMWIMNLANALVQSQVANSLRGRVMSVYMLTVFGISPIGSLLLGSAAERLGQPVTVAAGAALCVFVAIGLRTLAPRVWALP